VKLKEENIERFLDIGRGSDFLDMIPKKQGKTKTENEIASNKKLLYSKGDNQQNKVSIYGLEENILKLFI
jgi:hypothetical protein